MLEMLRFCLAGTDYEIFHAFPTPITSRPQTIKLSALRIIYSSTSAVGRPSRPAQTHIPLASGVPIRDFQNNLKTRNLRAVWPQLAELTLANVYIKQKGVD